MMLKRIDHTEARVQRKFLSGRGEIVDSNHDKRREREAATEARNLKRDGGIVTCADKRNLEDKKERRGNLDISAMGCVSIVLD